MAGIEWQCESCGKRNVTNYKRRKCFNCGHPNPHSVGLGGLDGTGILLMLGMVALGVGAFLAAAASPTCLGIPAVVIVVMGIVFLLKNLERS